MRVLSLFRGGPATKIVTREQLAEISADDLIKVEHLRDGTMRVTLGNLWKYDYLPFG